MDKVFKKGMRKHYRRFFCHFICGIVLGDVEVSRDPYYSNSEGGVGGKSEKYALGNCMDWILGTMNG